MAHSATKIFKTSQKQSNPDVQVCSRSSSIPVLDDAVAYFEEVFSDPPPDSKIPDPQSPTSNSPSQVCNLDSYFSVESIIKAIKDYPNGKSAGPDPISSTILKTLAFGSTFGQDLYRLFQLCLRLECTPSVWNISHIHPIPKSATSKTIDEFRPIALTCMLRRMFESCFLKFLAHSPLADFHPTQAGFRSGFSTITHSVVSNDCFELSDEYYRPHRIFIDLRQAYDRVIVPLLLDKIKAKSLPIQVINLIQSLFSNCKSTISVNGIISKPFLRKRGLFQGSLLSPFLFDIYIDDLACLLGDTAKDPSIPAALLFADDIQLLPVDEFHAAEMLDIVDCWCVDHGMETNVSKSAYVGPSSDWTLLLGGLLLPHLDSYKYLGFPTTTSGIDWQLFISNSASKASKILKFFQAKGSKWHPLVRLVLFKTFVRSMWEYGAPMTVLATPNLLSPLESLQQEALGWVCSSSKTMSSRFERLIRSITAVESIKDRFETLGIRFGYHFEKSNESNPIRVLVQAMMNNRDMCDNTQAFVWKQIHCRPLYKSAKTQPLPLKVFLKHRRLLNVSASDPKSKSDRIRLIQPSSRHQSSLSDISIHLKHLAYSKLAIYWRFSSLASGSKCPVCQQTFHHTHASKCLGLHDTDLLFDFKSIKALSLRLGEIITKVRPDFQLPTY
jgi:hypothetical protein